MAKVSRRSEAVDPFIVMDVMAAAAAKEAAGDTVIHLEVGQPSTPAPSAALAAAHAALEMDDGIARGFLRRGGGHHVHHDERIDRCGAARDFRHRYSTMTFASVAAPPFAAQRRARWGRDRSRGKVIVL